ncbi:hypothetical protein Q3G72_031350 [Acer saccharum]|nr:hypothetical protein Q3G72_031350 [Acer saccharum]
MLVYEFMPHNSLDSYIFDQSKRKIFTTAQSEANTNKIVGTRGYMAPEYAVPVDLGPIGLPKKKLLKEYSKPTERGIEFADKENLILVYKFYVSKTSLDGHMTHIFNHSS